MAEFKNLTSQIEVISSPFNDSINYYQKSNSDEVVQLGVRAEGGEVILSTINTDGAIIRDLETFEFSEITAPLLVSIDLTVEQINTWIHDEVREVVIDTPLTGSGGDLGGLKVSRDYAFSASENKITISDTDVDFVVSVFNESLHKMVYMKGSEEYTGLVSGDSIYLDITLLEASNGDKFYIKYKPSPEIGIRSILESINDKMDINNKMLTKIYNPE